MRHPVNPDTHDTFFVYFWFTLFQLNLKVQNNVNLYVLYTKKYVYTVRLYIRQTIKVIKNYETNPKNTVCSN